MIVNLNEDIARLLGFIAKFSLPAGNQLHPNDAFRSMYEKINNL